MYSIFGDRWQHCRSISGRRLYSRRLVRLRNRKCVRRKCHGGVRPSRRRYAELPTRCARYVQVFSTNTQSYTARRTEPVQTTPEAPAGGRGTHGDEMAQSRGKMALVGSESPVGVKERSLHRKGLGADRDIEINLLESEKRVVKKLRDNFCP